MDGKRDTVDDERVLYVHNMVGAHTANPMSGEFSVELSNAFWMEDGAFQEPVRSAMLSGNAFDIHNVIGGLSRETRTSVRWFFRQLKYKNSILLVNSGYHDRPSRCASSDCRYYHHRMVPCKTVTALVVNAILGLLLLVLINFLHIMQWMGKPDLGTISPPS